MPFVNQIHTDVLLSNVAIKYSPGGFVWDKVFPKVMVNKDSNKYRVYDRNLRVPETKRANKAVANEYSFEVTFGSYVLEKHALKDYVSDDDARNYDIFSLKSDTVENLVSKINMRAELMCAALMTKTGWSLTHSLAATTVWSLDTVASNPITDFNTATSSVLMNSGFQANKALVPWTTLQAIKRHQSIVDRFKYTSSEVGEAALSKLLGIDELVVPSSIYDSSNFVGATSTVGEIWNDNVLVYYAPASPGPLKPSAGYTFMLEMPSVKTWREEARESEGIEVNMLIQPKVVSSLAGYLICNSL